MSVSTLPLLSAVIVGPVLVNLLQWRRDRRHLADLANVRNAAQAPDSGSSKAPRVSFLIAAWNEKTRLQRCIDSILHLKYQDLEIIVCAGGTDSTWEVVSRIDDRRVVVLKQKPGDGKQESLRRCFERSNGDILYLLDADCLVTERAFTAVLERFAVGAGQVFCCGPFRPIAEQLDSAFILNQCATRTYGSLYQPELASGISGANVAMRRHALERAGGFRPDIGPGGDYDLGKRLLRSGARILHCVDMAVPMEFHSQVLPYLRQQSRWLRNVVIHGIRFHAYREVVMSIVTSLTGLTMLLIPCLVMCPASLSGFPCGMRYALFGVWTAGFLHAFFSRLRYMATAAAWLDIRFSSRALLSLPVFLLTDFLAWAIPLGQYPLKLLRERW